MPDPRAPAAEAEGLRAAESYRAAAAVVDAWYTERQAPTDRITGERSALILALEQFAARASADARAAGWRAGVEAAGVIIAREVERLSVEADRLPRMDRAIYRAGGRDLAAALTTAWLAEAPAPPAGPAGGREGAAVLTPEHHAQLDQAIHELRLRGMSVLADVLAMLQAAVRSARRPSDTPLRYALELVLDEIAVSLPDDDYANIHRAAEKARALLGVTDAARPVAGPTGEIMAAALRLAEAVLRWRDELERPFAYDKSYRVTQAFVDVEREVAFYRAARPAGPGAPEGGGHAG